MMEQNMFDQELVEILLSIIRDYQLWPIFEGWVQSPHLPYPPHQMIDILLGEGKLLIVVTDTNDDNAARINGLRESYTLMAALYTFLVGSLFPGKADEALDFSYYEASAFLVLVYSGPVPVVVEAIGRHIMPWLYKYYQQPKPEPLVMHNMAAAVLNASFGNPRDDAMRMGIIERVMPLRLTDLRPLKLVDPDVPATGPLPPTSQAASPNGANGRVHDEEATQPTDTARVNGHKPRTAPLPGYFDE